MNDRFPVYIDESLEGREEEFSFCLDEISDIAGKAVSIENIGDFEAVIVLADDSFIHELNRDYRGIDQVTDVLSFPANDFEIPYSRMLENGEKTVLEEGETASYSLGEIYIAVDRTRTQAEEYGNTFLEELKFLTVHGMLHLMGYDHIEKDDEMRMRQKQRIILGRTDE